MAKAKKQALTAEEQKNIEVHEKMAKRITFAATHTIGEVMKDLGSTVNGLDEATVR